LAPKQRPKISEQAIAEETLSSIRLIRRLTSVQQNSA